MWSSLCVPPAACAWITSLSSPEEDNKPIGPVGDILTEADLDYCMLIRNPREELLRTCVHAIVKGSTPVVGLPALRARMGACFEQCDFQRRVSAMSMSCLLH